MVLSVRRNAPEVEGLHGIVICSSQCDAVALIYSIHEAKARFSEIIRQVREGKTVTVSYRGEPVAEIHPIRERRKPTLDERLKDLERRGSLVRSALPRRTFGPVERRLGALSRFLAERGE